MTSAPLTAGETFAVIWTVGFLMLVTLLVSTVIGNYRDYRDYRRSITPCAHPAHRIAALERSIYNDVRSPSALLHLDECRGPVRWTGDSGGAPIIAGKVAALTEIADDPDVADSIDPAQP